MFVINFAGHDTTPKTLAFTMMLLAVNLDVQEWLREEIVAFNGIELITDWDYTIYSQLKLCQALFVRHYDFTRLGPHCPRWLVTGCRT
jgi:hypothetical protein